MTVQKLKLIIALASLISIMNASSRLISVTSVLSSSTVKATIFSNINWEGTKLLTSVMGSVDVWSKQSNGTYTLAQSIPMFKLVYYADFSRDSQLLVISSEDGLDIWKYNSTGGLYALQQSITTCHTGQIYKVRFIDDGSRIISGGEDGNFCVMVYDSVSGAFKQQQKVLAHRSLYSLAVNSGNVLITVGSIMTLKRWTYNATNQLYELAETIFPVSSTIYEVDLSQDDTLIVSGDISGGVQIASLTPSYYLRQELYVHTDIVLSVRFTPDKAFIVSAGMDDKVGLWSASSSGNYSSMEESKATCSSLSTDSSGLVVGGSYSSLDTYVWKIVPCPVNSTSCPCEPTYMYSNGTCQIDCSMFKYTNGSSGPNTCNCVKDHFWVEVSKRCFVDCTKIQHSTGINTAAYQCQCAGTRKWVGEECLIYCPSVQNALIQKGDPEYQNSCKCQSAFNTWSPQEDKCTTNTGLAVGLSIGLALLIGVAVFLGVYFWKKRIQAMGANKNHLEVYEVRSRTGSMHDQQSHTDMHSDQENVGNQLHEKVEEIVINIQPPQKQSL